MITDRGSNADGPHGSEIFPMPAFTPTITAVHLVGADAGSIAVDRVIPIADEAGAPVTGLPNDSNDDVAYASRDAIHSRHRRPKTSSIIHRLNIEPR